VFSFHTSSVKTDVKILVTYSWNMLFVLILDNVDLHIELVSWRRRQNVQRNHEGDEEITCEMRAFVRNLR
jgi:hypothetical protein